MATKSQVLNRAKALGVNVEVEPQSGRIWIEAPVGKVWTGTDLHELIGWDDDPHVWTSFLADMKDGFEDCETVNCEWCSGF